MSMCTAPALVNSSAANAHLVFLLGLLEKWTTGLCLARVQTTTCNVASQHRAVMSLFAVLRVTTTFSLVLLLRERTLLL